MTVAFLTFIWVYLLNMFGLTVNIALSLKLQRLNYTVWMNWNISSWLLGWREGEDMLTTWDLIGVSKRPFQFTGIFLFQNKAKMSGMKNTVTWHLYLSVSVSHIVPIVPLAGGGWHMVNWLNWLGAEGSHTHICPHKQAKFVFNRLCVKSNPSLNIKFSTGLGCF